jgi:hypothetical protein
LLTNTISERPGTTYAEEWYALALELQEEAMRDGYLVSVDLDYNAEDDTFTVSCVAVIDGDMWVWDPEEDHVTHYAFLE